MLQKMRKQVDIKEHDGEECVRYEIRASEMLQNVLGDTGRNHDAMLGLYARRTYRAKEIITVYVSRNNDESIGAVDGTRDT